MSLEFYFDGVSDAIMLIRRGVAQGLSIESSIDSLERSTARTKLEMLGQVKVAKEQVEECSHGDLDGMVCLDCGETLEDSREPEDFGVER